LLLLLFLDIKSGELKLVWIELQCGMRLHRFAADADGEKELYCRDSERQQ